MLEVKIYYFFLTYRILHKLQLHSAGVITISYDTARQRPRAVSLSPSLAVLLPSISAASQKAAEGCDEPLGLSESADRDAQPESAACVLLRADEDAYGAAPRGRVTGAAARRSGRRARVCRPPHAAPFLLQSLCVKKKPFA